MIYHVLKDFLTITNCTSFFWVPQKVDFKFLNKLFRMYGNSGFNGFFSESFQSLDLASSSMHSGVFNSQRLNRNYYIDNRSVFMHCTHRKVFCGELRMQDAGSQVEICGRIQNQRLGRFLSLRDDTGITQLVVPDNRMDIQRRLKNMPLNSFLALQGFVTARPNKSRNEKMATGDIEVLIENLVSVYPKRKRDESDSDGEDSKTQKKKKSPLNSASLKLTSEELSKCPTPIVIHHFSRRSHTCGELNKRLVGKNITLCGWVSAKRVGRFVMLKDGYGSVQIVPEIQNVSLISKFQNVHIDSILFVKGVVSRRPPGHENPRAENGNIEILVESLTVINPNDPAPPGEEDNGDSDDNDDSGRNHKCATPNNEDTLEIPETSIPNPNKYTLRTHTCGQLGKDHVGQKVRLMGWMEFCRMNKFVLLRDGYGKTQLVIPESRTDFQNLLKKLTYESVLLAEGTVCSRPLGQENAKQATGAIEISVTDLRVLNRSKKLPFSIREFNKPQEHLRLKYRYLDLRSETMQYNLRLRSKILHKMRRFLIEHLDFVEVETPTLFKRSPGGAQEFIVPTENEGKFYSLVQSPQQFKQLLMIGSVDRYFQLAHCYRDESYNNNRQPEFTQLDIEMSFCDRDSILILIEDLLRYCWPKHLGTLVTPFPRLSYEEAIISYGTDKPDLRFEWKLKNLTSLFLEQKGNCSGDFDISKFSKNKDFAVFAFVGRQGRAKFSDEAQTDIHNEIESKYPGVSFLFLPINSLNSVQALLESLFCYNIATEIKKVTDYEEEDVLFLALGAKQDVLESLGKIRINFANYLTEKKVDVIQKNTFNFLWILDFPLFEKNGDKIVSAHHPFTQPKPEDFHLLESDPLKVKSLHYDLVLNGNEIGGGSIRIIDCELQKMILEKILKLESKSFSHLLEGLASGAPPHGGIALGIDRLMAVLCGVQCIRDVIAFPKGYLGKDSMAGAPCDISEAEKIRYHIKTKT